MSPIIAEYLVGSILVLLCLVAVFTIWRDDK